MSVGPFISELVRAANEIERLAMYEQADLLQRAARTIRDMREEITPARMPANDGGPGEIVHDLLDLSERIGNVPPELVAAMLFKAVEDIKALRVLLESKRRVERGEA